MRYDRRLGDGHDIGVGEARINSLVVADVFHLRLRMRPSHGAPNNKTGKINTTRAASGMNARYVYMQYVHIHLMYILMYGLDLLHM